MTDRSPLAPILRRQRRDVNLLYRTMSDAIANAVDRLPGERDRPITEAERIAIMREVDAGLDVIWGSRPNDEQAAIRQIVRRDTRAARFRSLDAAVRDWRRALPRSVREPIDREARA